MSLWICPICGKQVSIRHYDPTDFEDDISIILKRGLGQGMGFEVVDRYSLLDGSDPDLLDLIRDRVAVIYNLLYEDVDDEDEDDEEEYESLSEVDKEILLAELEEEDISDLEEEVSE